MKKKFKFLLLAIFGLTTVLNVSAVSMTFWANVTLPRLSGVEMSDAARAKTIAGPQHFKTTKATDNLSGDTRAISISTLGKKPSEWISAPLNSVVTWSKELSGDNTNIGDYYLRAKATKSTLSTVTFSGTWYLDETHLQ